MPKSKKKKEPDVWDEWRRLTSFFESARLALEREKLFWQDGNHKPEVLECRTDSVGKYSVSLKQHIVALSDEWLLHSLVLVSYYALSEALAAKKLEQDVNEIGGIETWGKKLLDNAGSAWEKVKDGQRGVVEVAAIRNVVAHGHRQFNDTAWNRMNNFGEPPSWKIGEQIPLSYSDIDRYRARLKSLLRHGKIRNVKQTPKSTNTARKARKAQR